MIKLSQKIKLLIGLLFLVGYVISPITTFAQAYSDGGWGALKAKEDAQQEEIDRVVSAVQDLEKGKLNQICSNANTSPEIKQKCSDKQRYLQIANDGTNRAGEKYTLEERVQFANYAKNLATEILASDSSPEAAQEAAAITKNAAAPPPSTQPVPKGTCSIGWSFSIYRCFDLGVAWIFTAIGWLFSWVLWLANLLFNVSIVMSIKNFKSIADMPAIVTGWKIIRDIMNILFIGSLFYIAIGTILQTSSVDWKKAVPKIVLAALLINFSMLFTRIMIDASNVTAYTFYTKLAPAGAVTGAPDISTELYQNMNLLNNEKFDMSKMKPGAPTEDPGLDNLTTWQIIAGGIGKIIMYLVASFVLLVAAILFIVRTIVLTFLLILSPLAFIGLIIPKGEKFAGQWWDKLTNQLLFAPAYMACFFIVIQIVKNSAGLKTAIGNDGSVIMFFILINGLLMGCVFIAKSMGATGVDFATKVAKPLTLGLGQAAGGAIARNTIGRAATKISKSDTIKNMRLSNAPLGIGTGIRTIAGAVKGGLDKTAEKTGYTAKLDREAKEAQDFRKPAEAVRYLEGLSGPSRKKVYEEMTADQKIAVENEATGDLKADIVAMRGKLSAEKQAEIVKRRTKPSDQLRDITTADPNKQQEIFEKISAEDRAAIIHEAEATGNVAAQTLLTTLRAALPAEEQQKINDAEDKRAEKEAQRAGLDTARTALAAHASGTTPLTPAQIQAHVGSLTGDQTARLGNTLLTNPQIAEHLSAQQLSKLSDKLNQIERTAIRTAIQTRIAAAMASGTATASDLKTNQWFNTNPAGQVF